MSHFYVYVHHRIGTGVPFYVGKGKAYRCKSKHTRPAHWNNIVAKDGGFDCDRYVSQARDRADQRESEESRERFSKLRLAEWAARKQRTAGSDG